MRSSREYPFARPLERRRVALFGDSYAMGWGVDNAERFSDLLEAKYPNLDVMNFALSGAGMDQQLLIYENIAKQFEADAYIFAPCTIDITRNLLNFMPSISPDGIVYQPKPYFTLSENRLVLHNVPVPRKPLPVEEVAADREAFTDLDTNPYTVRIFQLIPQSIKKSKRFERLSLAFRRPYSGYDSKESESWLLTRAICQRFIQQVGGKPVLIVPIPTHHHIEMDIDTNYVERFMELNDAGGSCFVTDVLPYFKRLSPENRLKCCLENDSLRHYSPQGHRIVADAISDILTEHCPEILN